MDFKEEFGKTRGGEVMPFRMENREIDFKDLENHGLIKKIAEEKKQAKIEANDIINRLDPKNINSWAELLTTLEDCVCGVKSQIKIRYGTNSS